MPLLENVEIYWPKLDPKKPNSQFKPENPTWELQIQTKDKAVKKQWDELKFNVKAVVPDEGDPYYRINMKKNSIAMDGKPNPPIQVVDMELRAVDPTRIGNGSRANIRYIQREYTDKTGKPAMQSILMGVQIIELIEYEPQERDDEFKAQTF
jgi:hypothetical protein